MSDDCRDDYYEMKGSTIRDFLRDLYNKMYGSIIGKYTDDEKYDKSENGSEDDD